MEEIDNLIYDRTQEDVDRWKEMRHRGYDNFTEEEKELWNTGVKGAYNYTDINRVNKVVQYLGNLLNECGYKVRIDTLRELTLEDLYNKSYMDTYLENVSKLVDAYFVMYNTPEVPEYVFTVTGTNAIEKILYDINFLAQGMIKQYVYSGEIYSGEV